MIGGYRKTIVVPKNPAIKAAYTIEVFAGCKDICILQNIGEGIQEGFTIHVDSASAICDAILEWVAIVNSNRILKQG